MAFTPAASLPALGPRQGLQAEPRITPRPATHLRLQAIRLGVAEAAAHMAVEAADRIIEAAGELSRFVNECCSLPE